MKYKWLVGSLTLLVAISFFQSMFGCFSYRVSDSSVRDHFRKHSLNVVIENIKVAERTIHYCCMSTSDTLPLVIFVHGSPASMSGYFKFMTDSLFLKTFSMISVDRPGFGYSDYRWSMPSIKNQSLLLKSLIVNKAKRRPVILVGHSLGGPLVARMAMDYQDLIDGIVMIAPAISPELEPEEWYRPLLYKIPFRWIVPGSFRPSNDEIYHLKEELIEMKPLWDEIRIPVVVIQGGRDAQVHPGNAEFARKSILNAPVKIMYYEGMDHILTWREPTILFEALCNIIQSTRGIPSSK